jgi:hypothetical protein
MLNDIVFFGSKNVEALAAALDVPIERVVAAYLEAMGYPLPQVKITTERAIRLDERLSVDDRENLLALHRSMLRRRKLRQAVEAEAASIEVEESEVEEEVEARGSDSDVLARLSQSLEQSGVAKDEMASFLGVNVDQLEDILSGRIAVPVDDIVKLWAQRTGADAEWLRGDYTPPPAPKAPFRAAERN